MKGFLTIFIAVIAAASAAVADIPFSLENGTYNADSSVVEVVVPGRACLPEMYNMTLVVETSVGTIRSAGAGEIFTLSGSSNGESHSLLVKVNLKRLAAEKNFKEFPSLKSVTISMDDVQNIIQEGRGWRLIK